MGFFLSREDHNSLNGHLGIFYLVWVRGPLPGAEECLNGCPQFLQASHALRSTPGQVPSR